MATETERWVTAKQHPLEPVLRRVADLVLSDPRMTSYVKYGNLHFGYLGDMASFVQIANKKRLTLMFHRGAKLGDAPSFTGDGHSARFLTFTSVAEANARAGELRQLVARWCQLMDDEAARKPAAKPAKPTAAKPARTPAARPARTPAAKPAKPTAAKPTKPTAARPATPTAAKPTAQRPATQRRASPGPRAGR